MQGEGDQEGSSTQDGAPAGAVQASSAISPDVAAREDLIRWCGEHHLPVPPAEPAVDAARQ